MQEEDYYQVVSTLFVKCASLQLAYRHFAKPESVKSELEKKVINAFKAVGLKTSLRNSCGTVGKFQIWTTLLSSRQSVARKRVVLQSMCQFEAFFWIYTFKTLNCSVQFRKENILCNESQKKYCNVRCEDNSSVLA